MQPKGEVTRLISLWMTGDKQAENRLFNTVYEELQLRARGLLARERDEVSLSSAGLVNMAYMDLCKSGRLAVSDRAHFLNIAALVMRRIVVDRARARRSKKRGGGFLLVPCDEDTDRASCDRTWEVLLIDQLLNLPEVLSERQLKVLDMLYFAGYTVEETALSLNLSSRQVTRDFNTARARLRLAIGEETSARQSAAARAD